MITGRTSNAALALLPLLGVLSCGAEDEPALVSPSKSGKPRAVAPSQNPGKRAASDREVDNLLKQADKMAVAGNYEKADELYGQAWGLLRLYEDVRTHDRALWVLMSAVNMKFLMGEHDSALKVAQVLTKTFNRTMYVGNPLFHLRVGQCKLELAGEQGRRSATDELGRALIGGGVEMFDGEDDKYLELVTKALKPPAGSKTWEASRGRGGTTRDRLNGATGFLANLLEKKLGSPPPYR